MRPETQTLFLSWQTRNPTFQWFPVGRMDIVNEPARPAWYRFRYVQGVEQARKNAGFSHLIEFPDWNRDYEFGQLFPVFQNRVTQRRRPDFPDYMHSLGLSVDATPFEMLSVSGGRRVTDSYGVFPQLKKDANGDFACRFFLNGSRHMNQEARERIRSLRENESLHLELARPVADRAVQIHTEDRQMIGWSPRYLASVLAAAPEEFRRCCAKVIQNNFHRPDAVSPHNIGPFVNLEILIEMRGNLGGREPMGGEEFRPLVD